MDKNIENFINETKTELTIRAIVQNLFYFFLCLSIGGIFSFRLREFLLLGFLCMAPISILGFHYVRKKCDWGMSIYSGVQGLAMSMLLFFLSYVFLCLSSKTNWWILFMYIFIYLLCCVCFALNVWNGIKKDRYSKDAKQGNPAFAWLGAGGGMILAPIIFSNFNNNQVFGFLSFVFLFFGVIFTTSSSHFLTAYMQKKYS